MNPLDNIVSHILQNYTKDQIYDMFFMSNKTAPFPKKKSKLYHDTTLAQIPSPPPKKSKNPNHNLQSHPTSSNPEKTIDTFPKRHRYKWSIFESLQLQREYETTNLSIQQIANIHQRTVESIIWKLVNEDIEIKSDDIDIKNKIVNKI